MSYKLSPFTRKPDYYETGDGGTINNVNEHRLTLESGVPVSSTDQTAKTILYATPYIGDHVSLYDGSDWAVYTMAESSIKMTTSMSAVAVAGDTSLWVASTTTLFVGMSLVGSCISGLTITSITASNAVLLNASAASAGGLSPDFKLPSNTVWDVFGYLEGTTPKITFGTKWTNSTTRATAITTKDNIPVLTGTHYVGEVAYTEGKLKWIGTIGTTTTAGQTEDSETGRYVWNKYNKVRKSLRSYNTDTSWTLSGGVAAREYQNGTNQIRGKFVIGESLFFHISMNAFWSTINAGGFGISQIAIDSTSVALPNSGSTCTFYSASGAVIMLLGPAHGNVTVAAGYHYFTQIEQQSTANATNYPGGGVYSHLHTLWEG